MSSRSKIIVSLVFLFSLCCCAPRPRSVLSPKRMENVLYDLHHADGVLSVAGNQYTKDSISAKIYSTVLQKHGISQAEFDSSIVWYTDNPKIFDKIYPRVISRLEADLDDFNKEHESAKVVEQPMEKVEKKLPKRFFAAYYQHELGNELKETEALPLDSLLKITVFGRDYELLKTKQTDYSLIVADEK